ncbi:MULTISPECIES: restriction endonuclease subunit S [Bacillus]|uniref:restriction endonuclease subunit S n=1 Tax=Bacillus TaxID=1386 RepID=UPI0002DA6580|nr:restriction endonuclease subunit S [Bacillus subtilis]AMR48109.1 restriction endonuclease [Bacillus subtilis subsp. subtilis]AIX06444.1 Type-1 restriction enzyme EcoKI specificity protein [Bacillus subtilis]MDH3146717.1 restriction endonuclease subunit S [Bacillus subtilis]MED4473004.1 restriction endonuclease subunit S [Bacillus subtilis]QGH99679.1 restriction endonuclease subunit S [Bacillus subtilis]
MRFKESNIKGIGAIPSHWEIKELKFCLLPGSEGIKIGPFGSALKSEMLIEEGYKVYGQENLIKDDFTLGHRFISEEKFKELEVYEISENDVLISMMGTIGKCKVVPPNIEKGIMDSHLIRIRFNENLILPEFAAYLIQDSYYIKVQIDLYSKGSIMSGLNSSIIKNLKLVLPSIEEQKVILKYIRKKNTQLNQLIDSKNFLIDLLNQQRQSIITEAVTKGLNPNVKMKDSGVKWIGEIPQHWGKSKLKYLTRQIIDGTHHTPDYQDEGVPFLRVTDITQSKGKDINLSDVKYISQREHNELIKRCRPENGDLLVSKNGTIGIPKVIDWDWEFSIFVSLCLIKMNNEKLNTYFASFYFESQLVDEQIAFGSKKSTIINLHLDKVKEFFIFVPPLFEQNEIVKFLKVKISEVDNLKRIVENEIENLKEYRQALIYEAVTGKIDVRDMKLD